MVLAEAERGRHRATLLDGLGGAEERRACCETPAVAGSVLGIFVLVVLAATGCCVGLLLGVRTLARLALATYVVGMAEIVLLSLVLSTYDGLTRVVLVSSTVLVLVGVLGATLVVGGLPRPSLPSADWLRRLARTRPLLVLCAVVASALAYALALVLATPPNGWDQLNYHLARAALWVQDGVGYVGSPYDQRLIIYPPGGEIPFSFLLAVTRNENTAALAQLLAASACAVGVFALARRFELAPVEAAFGALLFLLLPIVLLQSTTTKNDVIVASLLASASVFLLGVSRGEVALAAVAVALAIGAKFTAGYGLVVLVLLALVARPRSFLTWRMGAIAIGTALGSYWYWVNAAEGGGLLGDRSGIPGLTAFADPAANLVSALGLAVDWLDLSGSEGPDILLYAVAAGAVAAGLAIADRGPRRWRSALLAGAVVASPLALWAVTTQVGRPALVALYEAVGRPPAFLADGAAASSPTSASDTGSWFGPTGLLLVLGAAAVVLARRRSLERTAFVAAFAPFVWMLLVALTLTYHPWQGRFFVYPVALSASLWGIVLRVRPLAWAVVALAGTTAFLTLVHYDEKPSGMKLLDRDRRPSVWSMPRSQVQSLHDPALAPVFRFLDEEVPRDASIALALGVNDFGYPAFGPHLQRRVTLVPFGSDARDVRSDWLYANPERAAQIDRSCWQEAFRADSGVVFERRTPECG